MSPRFRVAGAQQQRHRMAALAERTDPQRLPAITPTVRPARLRELAAARRRDATQRAHHLSQRVEQVDDTHARWVRGTIAELVREAEAFDAQADALEGASDVGL